MTYWLYWNEGSIIITTTEEYAQGKERVKYNQIAYEKIEEYALLVEGEEHLYNKILIYYEAILKENSYAYNENKKAESAQWAHSIMGGFLYNKFVCEGYAKLFQLLLNYSGIDNYYVVGDAGGGSHVCNLVCLDDGKWYWFDSTWDDTSYGNTYKYFCVIDNLFTRSHIPTSFNKLGMYANADLPERATTDYKNSDILEIGEEVIISNGVYILSSYGKLKYVRGTVYKGEELEYNGVIYNIIE